MTKRPFCSRLLFHAGTARRRGLGYDRSGLAALEFALMAPILSTLFVGTVDAAQAYIAQLQLSSAVNAGANYAIINGAEVTSKGNAASMLASAIATIVGNVNGNGWASGTVVVNNGPTVVFPVPANAPPSGTFANADSYYCLTMAAGVANWGPALTNNAVACSATEPPAGKFVTITASHVVAPIIPGLNFGDGQVSQSAVVQVQ